MRTLQLTILDETTRYAPSTERRRAVVAGMWRLDPRSLDKAAVTPKPFAPPVPPRKKLSLAKGWLCRMALPFVKHETLQCRTG